MQQISDLIQELAIQKDLQISFSTQPRRVSGHFESSKAIHAACLFHRLNESLVWVCSNAREYEIVKSDLMTLIDDKDLVLLSYRYNYLKILHEHFDMFWRNRKSITKQNSNANKNGAASYVHSFGIVYFIVARIFTQICKKNNEICKLRCKRRTQGGQGTRSTRGRRHRPLGGGDCAALHKPTQEPPPCSGATALV